MRVLPASSRPHRRARLGPTASFSGQPRRGGGLGRLGRLGRAGAMLLACLPALAAAQLSPTARQEIDGLLKAVGSSGCEFMRGGTAHPAAKAQEHLQAKFEYLDTRGQLKSAEDFIVKAGTRSSMTGEAYGIRCPGGVQQASDAWLQARLVALRAPRR